MTADTTTAPERIWINGLGVYGEFRGFGGTEYIRADLCRTPVAQDAEPVAWRLTDIEQGVIEYTSRKDRADHRMTIPGFEVTPLYAHPAPQPIDEAATLREQLAEAQAEARKWEGHALNKAGELGRMTARAEAAEAERDRFRADVDAVKRHIPVDYLIRHDVPGATGPTEKLDLGSAMRDYAEDRWSLIERYKTAEAALAAVEDHADVLAEALHHMVNASVHPDQMADEAIAAHQARRAGE